MKYFIYIMLLTTSFAASAYAADKTDGKSSAIAVERILCQPGMVAYTPSSDVDYKPGVDVNGNPVASADINPAPSTSAVTYTEVPLTINLADKLQLSHPAEAQAVVGSLRIYKDGRVLYNGQDISQQASAVCAGKTPDRVSVPPSTAASMAPASGNYSAPAPYTPSSSSDRDHIMRAPDGSAAKVNVMSTPEVPLPGTAAPSSTTPAH